MAGKIFINYRRDDASASARNIYDRLSHAFGKRSVFMDVDRLKPGQRFDEELDKALQKCDVFIAVIGPKWLTLLEDRGRSGQTDFVRIEIAKALARELLVIPVLVDKARLPTPEELPADVRTLVLHHMHELTHERFGREMDDLVSLLKAARPAARRWTAVAIVAGGVALSGLTAAYFQGYLFFTERSSRDDATLSAGEVFRDCPTCPDMAVVPAGTFTMGSPDTEPGRNASEGPRHEVRIPRAFAVGKFEISVKQYEEFVAASGGVADGGGCAVWTAYGHRFEKDRSFRTPSFSQGPTNPVVCVSWQTALTYANWLTVRTGKPYRLLSEAEWEYAARANSKTRYHFGDDEAKLCEFGNGADRTSAFLWGNHLCSDNVGVQTAEVGRYRPNSFGVHDMIGNASEWVMDCSNPNYVDAPVDGTAWMSGDCQKRVIRGGSWDSGPKDLRSATRGAYPMQGKDNIGFRIARDIVKP